MSSFDLAHLEVSLLPRQMGRVGLMLLVISVASFDFALSTSDFATPGFSVPLQSFSKAGSATLLMGLAHLGFSLLPQQFSRPAFPLFAAGLAWLEPLSSVFEGVEVGSFLPLRGLV